MQRTSLDHWSWVVSLLVCVGAGLPILFLADDDSFLIGRPAWIAVFVLFVVAMIGASIGAERHRTTLAAYGVQVAAAATLVLALPGAGWIPILLVFTAALGVYVVGTRTTLAVVALNTTVVATSTTIAGSAWWEALFIAGLYLAIQLGTVLTSLVLIHEGTMRRELTEAHVELRATNALLAESSRTEERLRIARDLHDLLGHQLTVLALELETAKHRDDDAARAHVLRAEKVARGLLADVRTTVGTLRHRAPDLRETLEGIVRDLPEPHVELRIDDDLSTDEAQTSALVRAVQEVVTNTIRHASATRLQITLRTTQSGAVELTATDDGRGASRVHVGNGLRGIVERFEALDGEVRFRGDDGFAVIARMPAV